MGGCQGLKYSYLIILYFAESGCDRGYHALQINLRAASAEQRQFALCSDRAEQEDPIQRSAQIH